MKRLGWIPIIAGTVLLLAACGRDRAPENTSRPAAATPESATTPQTPAAPSTAATAESDAGAETGAAEIPMVTAEERTGEPKSGKPGAPIELKYQVAASPEVGQPLGIDFALVPQKASPAMGVMVGTSGDLTLQQSSAPPVQRNVEAGSEYWHQLVVIPNGSGTFSVNIIATLGEGAQTVARTFSIPIVVGSPLESDKARKPSAPVDATGQRIEPMPGEESR